jgi:hypothetical protein
MPTPNGLFELRRTRNHTVILLVAGVDRRMVPALHFVSRLACNDSRALHIAVEAGEAQRLAADWRKLGLSWLPLHIGEATGDLPASVRAAIGHVAATTDRVTVVVPELDIGRWWQTFLYRGNARRIAARLQPMAGVTTVIVPFCVSHQVEAHRAPSNA